MFGYSLIITSVGIGIDGKTFELILIGFEVVGCYRLLQIITWACKFIGIMSNLREDLFYFDEDENENENNPESQAPPINPKTFRNTSPNKPSIIGEATRITKSIFTRDIDGDEDQYQHQRGQKYSSPKQKTTKNDPLRTTNITKYATEKLIEDQKQHKVVEEKSHPPELPLEEFLIPNFSDN